MLYIFDLGNVIVDIDFNRALGVWSDYSRVPLASLQQKFRLGEPFYHHERGQISDAQFAAELSHEMEIALSYEQFSAGWLAIFLAQRQQTLDVMQALRAQGERVVILSNTNNLHTEFWREKFPDVINSADKIYLSHEMGMRKPDAEIYRQVLQEEGVSASEALFFDDNEENISGAKQIGINSIWVSDSTTIPNWFKQTLC